VEFYVVREAVESFLIQQLWVEIQVEEVVGFLGAVVVNDAGFVEFGIDSAVMVTGN
jgi:hypothetical protein